jgi:hypothetical protein
MKKIFGILSLMMLLLVGSVFAVPVQPITIVIDNGLEITAPSFQNDVINNQNFSIHFGLFEKLNGLQVANTNATCIYVLSNENPFSIYQSGAVLTTGKRYYIDTFVNATSDYALRIKCNTTALGGYAIYEFTSSEETNFGLWKPIEDWTFPSIYLIICFVLIMIGLIYSSSFVGIMGSIMLFLSYFIIGATAPILFVPILIIGLLLAVKFGTM